MNTGSKSLARELFKRVPTTDLTAADIRRGAHSIQLANIIDDFSNSKLNLSILELQDESIDELLSLLKPFCYDKAKAPVICLDYLQIVPSSKDSRRRRFRSQAQKIPARHQYDFYSDKQFQSRQLHSDGFFREFQGIGQHRIYCRCRLGSSTFRHQFNQPKQHC